MKTSNRKRRCPLPSGPEEEIPKVKMMEVKILKKPGETEEERGALPEEERKELLEVSEARLGEMDFHRHHRRRHHHLRLRMELPA